MTRFMFFFHRRHIATKWWKHIRSCAKYIFFYQWTFAYAIVACWGVSWIKLTVQVWTEKRTIADVFVRLPAAPPTAFGSTPYSLLGSCHTFCEFQTETQKQCHNFVEVFWSHEHEKFCHIPLRLGIPAQNIPLNLLAQKYGLQYQMILNFQPPFPLNGNLINTSYIKKISNYEL